MESFQANQPNFEDEKRWISSETMASQKSLYV